MPKHKVVLYNPRSVFFDMPLALLAIGSALDSRRFEVEIIDARLTQNPQQALAAALPGALCLGITVLTGAPLADALEMSRYAKRHFPQVPVIWGGWHPSLFPTGPLVDVPEVDITVQGQGEETFRELTEAFAAGNPVDEIPGMAHRRSGEIVRNAPRPLADMNVFPRVDYDLIDVEAYFAKKGRRQFDYISSTGCFFRCSFCADPFVFQRKYSALSPERMISDLRFFQERYGFTDLNFQDETFFTYRERIAAFAAGLVENGIRTTWAATMRADQGSRLGDEVWQLCKKSGLRRLLIGVESGSQEMMDWLKKDIRMEQVMFCAEKCRSLEIGVIFPFIVGFPGESEASVAATVAMVKQLREMSPDFQTPIFYFKPYPGSAITREMEQQGFRLPQSTEEWAGFDYIGSSGPWVSRAKERFMEAFKFYLRLAFARRGALLAPLQALAKWRLRRGQFALPLEKIIIEKVRPGQRLS